MLCLLRDSSYQNDSAETVEFCLMRAKLSYLRALLIEPQIEFKEVNTAPIEIG
jgi:hypothetical protein